MFILEFVLYSICSLCFDEHEGVVDIQKYM